MPEIDGWADCLSPDLRAVWPLVAAAVADVDGALFGGTALAIHLRHRQSFDLDYLVAEPFAPAEVADRLTAGGHAVRILGQDEEGVHAVVAGVTVQVFRPPARGYNPGLVRTVAAPSTVDGLAVASLPDLLASKLDILLYRRTLRDYIDLAAIDAQSPYSLEDGLLFHAARYGDSPGASDASSVISLLEDPDTLPPDSAFDADRAATLDYLKARAPALRRHLHHQILANETDAGRAPQDRPDTAGPTDTFKKTLRPPGIPT